MLLDVVITQNATQGISFGGSDDIADHSTVTSNGMTGVHANEADGLYVLDSVISDNHAQGFNPGPSTVGMKLTRLVGLTVRNNLVEDNASDGIWLDESVRKFSIVGNTSTGNAVGIMVELAANGVVAANSIDGRSTSSSGVLDLNSGSLTIAYNAIAGIPTGGRQVSLVQDARRQANPADAGRDPRMPRPDPTCPWIVENVTVANNTFDATGNYQLFVHDDTQHLAAGQMGVTVSGNVFAPSAALAVIGWGQAAPGVDRFQSASALDASTGRGWQNAQTATGSPDAAPLAGEASPSAVVVPVSDVVAAATGWSAGARLQGPPA